VCGGVLGTRPRLPRVLPRVLLGDLKTKLERLGETRVRPENNTNIPANYEIHDHGGNRPHTTTTFTAPSSAPGSAAPRLGPTCNSLSSSAPRPEPREGDARAITLSLIIRRSADLSPLRCESAHTYWQRLPCDKKSWLRLPSMRPNETRMGLAWIRTLARHMRDAALPPTAYLSNCPCGLLAPAHALALSSKNQNHPCGCSHPPHAPHAAGPPARPPHQAPFWDTLLLVLLVNLVPQSANSIELQP
jgi:hypothetical protein